MPPPAVPQGRAAVGRLPRAGQPDPAREWVVRALVWAIALHSIVVGAVLLLAAEWSARFGGWGEARPLFFVRQFGVFHFAIAAAYLIEYVRYRGVAILLGAKTIAVVSLLWAGVRDGGPWAVPLAAFGDAMMALAVVAAVRRARGSQPRPAGW